MTRLLADDGRLRQAFIPGLDLAQGFFEDLVHPMLDTHMPDLSYSAGVLGGGSDVLGFDTEMSADHDWGPRVMLFLRPAGFDRYVQLIRALAMKHLPLTYRDYPLRIYAHDVRDPGVRSRQRPNDLGLEPRIEIYTLRDYFARQLGVDPEKPLLAADWLTMTQHRLCSMVSGRVFRDDVGLRAMRDHFAWYPHDVWLYVLASCWARMAEDEPLTGRAGSVGDELGASVIAWRIVRDMMRLAFLMERSYPPYPKWFGSAFAQLRCAPGLLPLLERIGTAESWRDRDTCLGDAYRYLAEMHNALEVTPRVPCEPRRFPNRPITVSQAGAIVEALLKEIEDPSVRAIADKWLIGSIDLFNDNHLLDDDPAQRHLLFPLYDVGTIP